MGTRGKENRLRGRNSKEGEKQRWLREGSGGIEENWLSVEKGDKGIDEEGR